MEQITPEVIAALATLRLYARGQNRDVRREFNTLDDAGVFAVLDEAVQSDRAEAILAESAGDDVRKAREALVTEGIRTGYTAASRLGKLERVPGTDTLQPVHEHVFRSPHSDEICYGAEWCTVTYREHRAQADRPTGRPAQCGSCGLRVADGSEYHETCRPISD